MFQSSLYNAERKKSWWNMFYHSTEPITCPNQEEIGSDNVANEIDVEQFKSMDTKQYQPTSITQHQSSHSRYKSHEFEFPVEINKQQRSPSRSPYLLRRHDGYVKRPLTPDSYNDHWHVIPPPIAG